MYFFNMQQEQVFRGVCVRSLHVAEIATQQQAYCKAHTDGP